MKIFLIDDKKVRQQSDYKWTDERFHKFKDLIERIFTLDELEKSSKEIFTDDNIIIYHESFIDPTNLAKESAEKRKKLSSWSKSKGNLLVYFSGSKDFRKIEENVAHLPVSVLYTNLEIFLYKILENDLNLKYLLFGENINLEEDLREKQDSFLRKTINEKPQKIEGNNLFIHPHQHYVLSPIQDVTEQTLFSDVSDKIFTEKINKWLCSAKYNNIFVPLCFGNILSDFNGLRFAAHIRCTNTINQKSRIFIYGYVGLEYLIEDKYFNILKTKNINLIEFSKTTFAEVGNKMESPLIVEELATELSKLKLDVPVNYYDSHHIANEWGIFQMARNAGIKIDDIEGFEIEKMNSIYFKWLIAKNNLYEELPDEQDKQQREYIYKIPGFNVQGKIDLTKFKKR
jgi:hypothetical protein